MWTKADFRALREMLGITQTQLAHALNVDSLTVRRWERQDMEWQPSADAWELLERKRKEQLKLVDRGLSIAETIANATGSKDMTLVIWRTKEDYANATGRPGDEYTFMNAAYEILANALEYDGYSVRWLFGGSEKWEKLHKEAKKNQILY